MGIAKVRAAVAPVLAAAVAWIALAAQSKAAGQAPPRGIEPLRTGTPAPAFVLTDQFGREQSSASLKGPKGTILLFFRSADW